MKYHGDLLRSYADILRRAIDTPLTGAAVPANAGALRALAGRLDQLADGDRLRKVFPDRPRRRGAKGDAELWTHYWCNRVRGMKAAPALRLAFGKTRVARGDVANLLRQARRHRKRALARFDIEERRVGYGVEGGWSLLPIRTTALRHVWSPAAAFAT